MSDLTAQEQERTERARRSRKCCGELTEARRLLDVARKAFHSILVQKKAYGQCLEVVSPECYEGIAARALAAITPTEKPTIAGRTGYMVERKEKP